MRKLSFSTSWRSGIHFNAADLAGAFKDIGIDIVELEFRVGNDTYEEFVKNRERLGMSISSLHAVCPAPYGRGKGAERFLLTEEDETDRNTAVADVVDTLKRGVDVGAGAVVVHSGRVPLEEPIYKRMRTFDEGRIGSPESGYELHSILLDRTKRGKRAFQSLLKSLDEINEAAVTIGIDVGLENRYYFGEMPNIEEFGVIFNMFDGGRLKYWHDTGHAQVQEALFGFSHKVLIETFSEKLIGVHLHDVQGYTDHLQPGSGSVDFAMVRSFMKPETIRVVELNPRVSRDEAFSGIAHLRGLGF